MAQISAERPELATALGVVAQACAAFQGDLGAHQQIQGALQTVAAALEEAYPELKAVDTGQLPDDANGDEPRTDPAAKGNAKHARRVPAAKKS
jgi:hypothetical protein